MKSFRNLSKRTLALFLALVMSLSLVQVTALAAPRTAGVTDPSQDQTPAKITFAGCSNGPADFTPPAPLEALPGQSVVLPDVSDQNAPGAAFDLWKKDDATYYKPGQVLAMPEGGMTLTAQWGHVEVELHVGNVTIPEPVGNQMADNTDGQLLSFESASPKISKTNIVSVTFVDELVSFIQDPIQVLAAS